MAPVMVGAGVLCIAIGVTFNEYVVPKIKKIFSEITSPNKEIDGNQLNARLEELKRKSDITMPKTDK